MTRRRLPIALAAALAVPLVLAGCGGSASKPGAAATPPATTGVASGGSTGSTAPPAAGGGFCVAVTRAAAEEQQRRASGTATLQDELQGKSAEVQATMQALLRDVPAELQAPATTLRDTFQQLMKLMGDGKSMAELVATKGDELRRLSQAIETAENQINAYSKQHCGVAPFGEGGEDGS